MNWLTPSPDVTLETFIVICCRETDFSSILKPAVYPLASNLSWKIEENPPHQVFPLGEGFFQRDTPCLDGAISSCLKKWYEFDHVRKFTRVLDCLLSRYGPSHSNVHISPQPNPLYAIPYWLAVQSQQWFTRHVVGR